MGEARRRHVIGDPRTARGPPRAAGIAARITDFVRFGLGSNRFASTLRAQAATQRRFRSRTAFGLASASATEGPANLGADRTWTLSAARVAAWRKTPRRRAGQKADAATGMGAPSAPRCDGAHAPRRGAGRRRRRCLLLRFFGSRRAPRRVGTRMGSGASRAVSRARALRRRGSGFRGEAGGARGAAGARGGGAARCGTAGSSRKAASAVSCLRNSRITSSETSSWPSCASCSRTASTEIPARVSGADSIVPLTRVTATADVTMTRACARKKRLSRCARRSERSLPKQTRSTRAKCHSIDSYGLVAGPRHCTPRP